MVKNSFFAFLFGALLFTACNSYDNPITPTPNPDPYGIVGTWTWDTGAPNGYLWGNMGYCGGNGTEIAALGYSLWFGFSG